MSRWLRALVIVLLAASCGGGGSGRSPNNLEDACAILKERPHYTRAFRAAERKWGVPVHVQMATIYQESKFKSDARTPFRYSLGVIPYGRQSSAFGYSQALDGTWDEYLESTGTRRDLQTRESEWCLAHAHRRAGPGRDSQNRQGLGSTAVVHGPRQA